MIVGYLKSFYEPLSHLIINRKFKKMKQIKIVIAFIVAISSLTFFTACNSNGSSEGKTTNETIQPSQPPVTTSAPQPEMTEAEKYAKKNFAFWAKELKVKAMEIKDYDAQGEGEGNESGTTLTYTFFFSDSLTKWNKEWYVSEFIAKVKPTDSSKISYYNRSVEDFNKAKKLYEEITKIPLGKLYVEGNSDVVFKISKKVDLTQKKIGNAIIIQDSIVKIWSRYGE